MILIMTYLRNPDYDLFAWSWLSLICMILIMTYLHDPDYHLFAWSRLSLICMIRILTYLHDTNYNVYDTIVSMTIHFMNKLILHL